MLIVREDASRVALKDSLLNVGLDEEAAKKQNGASDEAVAQELGFERRFVRLDNSFAVMPVSGGEGEMGGGRERERER